MTISRLKKSVIIGSILATTAAFSNASYAGRFKDYIQPLSGADTLLSTYVSKSRISGALRKESGYLVTDDGTSTGNFLFDFSGDIYYPITSPFDGKLKATSGPIGTVSGTVLFPQEFAQLAFAAYGAMTGLGPALDPAAIPASIHWTMQDITIVDAGTTYVPIPSDPEDMGLYGRAFTGLGPVEMGQLDVDGNGAPDMSMSVRMGGCFAVQAVDGVEAGRIGTYCLNSTFTFDLSGINYSQDPMVAATSTITGIGSSNCTTVLHTPMQMPE